MKTLVTGAGGFVGANLVRALLAAGHQVTAVVRPGSGMWRLAGLTGAVAIEHAQLDRERETQRLLRRARPEWLFHCAASGGYSWETDAKRIFRSNLFATVHLVTASMQVGVHAFVNTGSSSEYGFRSRSSCEDDDPRPNSTYAISKAAATAFCSWTAALHQLPLVTLRLYSVFGPYEEPRRLVPSLLVHALDNRLPPLASPATARDFVFIDDVCRAYLQAAPLAPGRNGRIYNVGSGAQTTLAEVVGLVREMLKVEQEPRWGSLPDRTWDTNVWQADVTRSGEELGWRPQCSVREGLQKTIAWLRDRPDLIAHYRDDLFARTSV